MRRLTLISLLLLLAACADEQWITISVENQGSLTLETVEVEVVASMSTNIPPEPAECQRERPSFTNDAGPLNLPLELVIASESDGWNWVAIRAVGSDSDGEQVSAEGLFPFPLQGNGTLLLGRCGEEPCPRGEVCDTDREACIASPAGLLLDAAGCE